MKRERECVESVTSKKREKRRKHATCTYYLSSDLCHFREFIQGSFRCCFLMVMKEKRKKETKYLFY
jgi:hypothetical protein